MGNQDERESIWSIRKRWRPFYSVLFVGQTFGWLAYRILETAPETALMELHTIGARAAVGTLAVTEALDIMLGTRDAINDWLQKRREQAYDQGVADRDQEWQTWNADRIASEERGEPFDVPPPGSNDDKNGR